jgi:ABC-type cobalamin transport system permease subunit
MHDVAMRRRIAALVIAAMLAVSGAALTTAYFAADAQARNFVGTDRGERIVGTDG